ncbi:MAG: hypothetical protein E6I91_03475 [Chloroflexi bacterium]|nr:MAG: hypothetical protein E6I91_03475 [Chloroflexota bacterium]
MQAQAQTQTNSNLKVRVTPIFHKSSAKAVHASAVNGTAPHTANVGTAQGRLLHNFKGLNGVDTFNANGFILEPPDQGLCVGYLGKTKVVNEIINDVTAFYTPNGTLVSSKINLNTFFGEPAALNISDPRCYYDTTTQAWFFSVVVYTNTLIPNHTDILVVNKQLQAAVYHFDTTLPGNTAGLCPCFGDQPKLGIDKNNVYISVDQFGGPGQSLETGADLFAVSKSQLVKEATTVNFAEFNNLSLGGIGVTALQPAINNSNSNVEYLLNSFPYADEAQLIPNTIEKLLGLWALSDTGDVTTGGVPKLSATLITSEIYGAPTPALSTGGRAPAPFSNDSRMQQVQYINGHLLGALDSAISIDNDPVTRDGAAWFEIKPQVDRNGKISGGKFEAQGYVGVKGKYLVYPAIAQTYEGTTGIGFSITSPTLNPSTGYVLSTSQHGVHFGGAHITAFGSGPDIGFTCALPAPQTCRWGDYSWTALDPNGKDLWMADELTVPQVATQPNTKPPAQINWGTQVWEVEGRH